MENEATEALVANLVTLSEKVDLDAVVPYLQSKKILLNHHVEQIKALTLHAGRLHLVTLLQTRGPRAFSTFCEGLVNAGQEHLSQLLESSRLKVELPTVLTEAIDYLKDVYLNECEIMKKHWSKLMDYPEEFEMNEMYINLEIVKEGRRQWNHGEELNVVTTYPEFFGVRKGRRTYRKIVLEGDPGMGKSTYLHRLVQKWAEGDEWLNKEFNLVFLARLGEIDSTQSLENMILPEIEDKFTQALMGFARNPSNHKRILIVLDAFDEMPGGLENIQNLMIKNNKLGMVPIPNVTTVISTRISHSLHALLITNDFRLRTMGFDVESVKQNFSSKIQNLEQLTQHHGQIDLYKNPLFVGMAASVGHIPDELYDLMNQFCQMGVDRYLKIREPVRSTTLDTNQIWNLIAEMLGWYALSKLKTQFLHFLPLESNRKFYGKPVAPEKFAGSGIRSFSELIGMCVDIGLLWPQKQSKHKKKTDFLGPNDVTFPHQLFVDYFAAMACKYNGLAEELCSSQAFAMPGFHFLVAEPFNYFLTGTMEKWKLYVCQNLVQHGILQCPWIYKSDNIPPETDLSGYRNISVINGFNSQNPGKFLKLMMEKNGNSFMSANDSEYASFCNLIFDYNYLPVLKKFHDLKCLNFFQVSVDNNVSSQIEKWLHRQKLESIACQNCSSYFLSILFESLNEPQISSSVHELSIWHDFLSPFHAVFLENYVRKSICLKRFELLHCRNLSSCWNILEALPERLIELKIENCQQSELTVACIKGYLRNNSNCLEVLHLSGHPLIGQSNELFEVLPASLQKLTLTHCSLSVASINSIGNFLLQAQHLKELAVPENPIIGTVPEFAKILFGSQLEVVRMAGCRLSHEFLQTFLRCSEQKKSSLKTVYVPLQEIDDPLQRAKMEALECVDGRTFMQLQFF